MAKPSPPTSPARHAARHRLFEEAAEQSALAKAAVAVLGKGRMIRDRAFEPQSTEASIRQIEVRLFAQAPL
jgi:hypothetical protein